MKQKNNLGDLKKRTLNAEQEKFCQLYTSQDSEFYGNGTVSYIEAYGAENKNKNFYKVAGVNASKLLKKAQICERINELLDSKGFNDENVDKQHLFLLNQFADLKTKLGAISEYNKLKARIRDETKIQVAIAVVPEHLAHKLKELKNNLENEI